MGRFAIIDDGVVTNIAEADEPLADNWIADTGNAQIGGTWDGAAFHPVPVPSPPAPQSVSMRQARLALLAAGLLDGVEAAIKASDRAAEIEWEYAADVRRDHPMIAVMQQAQGLSDAQVDTLFTEAARL